MDQDSDQHTDQHTDEGKAGGSVPDSPDRRQHPVVAGLTALIGVGLAIGLLAGGGTLLATRVLGLGDESTAVDSAARQSMYLPLPEKTTPTSSPSVQPTQTAALPPTAVTQTTEQAQGITLDAAQTQVAPMGRIDLTGTYPTGEGAILQVQRAAGPGDSWVDFPVTVTVSGGQFSTYVQTGRAGPNRFRVVDTDTSLASGEVTVSVS